MKKALVITFTVLVTLTVIIGLISFGFISTISAINNRPEPTKVEQTPVPTEVADDATSAEASSAPVLDTPLMEIINALPTAPGNYNGYDRDMFGNGWLDTDRNGCDARNDVLARDLTNITLDVDQCRVLTGTLVDPYTGKVVDFVRGQQTSQEVPIDHIVPLSYAHAHGANNWTTTMREQFANDLRNLIATTQEPNSSKGNSGPSEWMPSNTAYTCEYVSRFTSIIQIYSLTVSEADKNALYHYATSC